MGSKTKTNLKDKLDGNELDLSLCDYTKVPVKEIAALTKATTLDLSCNKLTVLPDNFCTLTRFVKLDLSKNALSSLPENFGELTNLRHLDLLGNKLQKLPISFANLESLKWLDLKNNPLVEPPQKLVGDCLDDKQCKLCAQRVLRYMRDLKEIHDRRNEALKERERAKEAEEEAKRLAEEKKQKERRKKQKLQEKERRRAQYQAAQAAKEQEEAAKQIKNETETEKKADDESPKVNGTSRRTTEDNDGSWSGLFFLLLLFVLLLGVAVGSYIHCQENKEIPWCRQLNDYIRPIQTKIETWVK